MSFEQRNAYFCKAQTDMQMIYIEAEREAKQLKTENAKLRELITDVHDALCADKVGMFHKLILASMEDDMRELGIEVSE